MTTRVVLDPAEQAQLAMGALAEGLPQFTGARLIVCEEDGHVIGQMALVPLWHIEGTFVVPGKRGTGVFEALTKAMHADARALGLTLVYPATDDKVLARYITRQGGVEIPARWFALAVREE